MELTTIFTSAGRVLEPLKSEKLHEWIVEAQGPF